MIAQHRLLDRHSVDQHLQGGGKRLVIGLGRIDPVGGGLAQDAQAPGVLKLLRQERQLPFELAAAHPVTDVVGLLLLPRRRAPAPLRFAPFTGRSAEDERPGDFLPSRRITVGYQQVHETAGHHSAAAVEGIQDQRAQHRDGWRRELNAVRVRHAEMRERDRRPARGQVLMDPPAGIHASHPPLQRNILMRARGEVRRGHVHADDLTGTNPLHRRRIDRQRVALIDDGRIVAEFLGRAVVVEEAVVLPFDVVQLGVDVGRDLLGDRRSSLVRNLKLQLTSRSPSSAPTPPYSLVDERLAFVQKTGHVVEAGAHEGEADDLVAGGPWPFRNRRCRNARS